MFVKPFKSNKNKSNAEKEEEQKQTQENKDDGFTIDDYMA
jgi:hypothetical protein